MRKKILEIGCGEGVNTYYLSKKNDIIGIDISEEVIVVARRRFPSVDYRVMNTERLEFTNDYFDQVYALDVLEHVDNLDRVIAEVWRVLRPGGEFIANIPYWKSEQWLLKLRPTYFKEIHHSRIFGENTLEELLGDNKFSLIKKARAGFLSHVFQYYMFKRTPLGKTQLGIGDWRDNWKTKTLSISLLFFDERLFQTPLKYCPVWFITLPLGLIINFFGNIFFPKSFFYKFKKYA
ncbi:MAG: class I SAM-dependent methyltransferase [Candidatus Omnitrophota bacterium]